MTDWTILAVVFWDHFLRVLTMIGLLSCSAFFSGSETAFFNLSRQTVRRFSSSEHRLERLIPVILRDPNRFLSALLLGNMTVNILYFAVSSTLIIKIARLHGNITGTAFGILFFFLLLFFGEILPKSIAYASSIRFSLITSPACYLLVTLLRPIIQAINWAIIQPVIRLFIGPRMYRSLSTNQLKVLLDSSLQQGLISNDENQLLSEILKLNFLKVRHVMIPRVQMPACSMTMPPRQVMQEMNRLKINKIPIFKSSIDHIVGIVYLRDVLLNPSRSLEELVHKVHFVPEQKTVESLVEFFNHSRSEYAIVVDEYGGVAGQVDLENIIDQLLGPPEMPAGSEPIEQIGPLHYRLHANLAISEWAEAFGIDLEESRLKTIGGFVTALLQKIPRQGDSVVFGNIRFTIETVQNNRVLTMLLTLEPLAESKESER